MQKNSIPVLNERVLSMNFGDGKKNLGTIVFVKNQENYGGSVFGESVFAAHYYRDRGSDVCINYEQARSGKVEKIVDSIIVTSPEMTTRDCGPFEGLYVILNNKVYSFSGKEYSDALDKYTKSNFSANTFLDCHGILTCNNWTTTLINDPIVYDNTLDVVKKYLILGKPPCFVLDKAHLDDFVFNALYCKDKCVRDLQEVHYRIQNGLEDFWCPVDYSSNSVEEDPMLEYELRQHEEGLWQSNPSPKVLVKVDSAENNSVN